MYVRVANLSTVFELHQRFVEVNNLQNLESSSIV